MKKYISDVKQLKMNKFIKSIWQWNISAWNGTLKVTSLRPYMDGVDQNDALLGNCSSCRKALKWKTKIAVHMMEEVILNAFILYNKPGRSMGLLKFKLQFIRSILISKRDNNSLVVRTNSTYFLESIPLTSRKSNSRGRCATRRNSEKKFVIGVNLEIRSIHCALYLASRKSQQKIKIM